VFSQNKNLKQRALSQGGGTLQDFEMFALDMIMTGTFSYHNILGTSMMPH
jgi:hypothetical protein